MQGRLLSILVPVYNNAPYLKELYARIAQTMDGERIPFELLLVNDGSRDDSWQIIAALAEADQRVKALCLSRNFGQHAAISAALENAKGEVCVLMDADLQDRPEYIPALLKELETTGNDITYTTKVGGDDGLLRGFTSAAFHSAIGRITGSSTTRNIGTFRAFNRKVASALLLYGERAVVYGPLMHTMGFKYSAIEVPRDPRIGSGSSYSFARRLALAAQSLVSYSTLPQRLFYWIGGSVSAASLCYLLVVLLQYVFGSASLPRGLTLIAVLLLLLIGLMMLGMGVLASYLFMIFREVLHRPRYHVQQSINL